MTCQPSKLNSIPLLHSEIRGVNSIHKIVLWSLQVHCGMHDIPTPCMHIRNTQPHNQSILWSINYFSCVCICTPLEKICYSFRSSNICPWLFKILSTFFSPLLLISIGFIHMFLHFFLWIFSHFSLKRKSKEISWGLYFQFYCWLIL